MAKMLTPKEIVSKLDERVVGQTDAKKLLATTIGTNAAVFKYNKVAGQSEFLLKPLNVTLIGGSGTGKTYLIDCISKILNWTVIMLDATDYSQRGYVGGDTNDIKHAIYDELEKHNKPIIVFLDEVDKLGSIHDTHAAVSTTNVQHELLKLAEDSYLHDRVMWVFAGAFTDIREKYTKAKSYNLGFINSNTEKTSTDLNQDFLLAAGLTPEFVGRMGCLALLDNLTEEMLMEILENHSQLQYQILEKILDVTLVLTKKEKDAIVKSVAKKKLGARPLLEELQKIYLERLYI